MEFLKAVKLHYEQFPLQCQTLRAHGVQHTNSMSLLKLISIKSVMPSNHLILYRPLLPPSIFPSIRVFSNESAFFIRWPKYSSFSFNISPSNEYSGLIFFRIHWLALLAVQGMLKSLLQHHSSKASILRHSAFFIKLFFSTSPKTLSLRINFMLGYRAGIQLQGSR